MNKKLSEINQCSSTQFFCNLFFLIFWYNSFFFCLWLCKKEVSIRPVSLVIGKMPPPVLSSTLKPFSSGRATLGRGAAGSNTFGQLGLNTTASSFLSFARMVRVWDHTAEVTAVAAGFANTVVIAGVPGPNSSYNSRGAVEGHQGIAKVCYKEGASWSKSNSWPE